MWKPYASNLAMMRSREMQEKITGISHLSGPLQTLEILLMARLIFSTEANTAIINGLSISLGTTIDQKLKFDDQVNYLCEKAVQKN